MIFQDANLLPWRNLWQNIHFPFEIKKIDSKPYEARIKRLLDEVGLAGFEKKIRASSPAACSSAPASCAASPSIRT